jgi:tellurite resistance protein
MAALSTAWQAASIEVEVPLWISDVIGVLAVLVFCTLTISYTIKCVVAAAAVKSEFNGPDHGASFASFVTSLLLVSDVIAPVALPLARVLWCLGAVGIAGFLCLMVPRWVRHIRPLDEVTPIWLVPVVGLFEVPIALRHLGWASVIPDVSFASLAVGLLLAIPLLTLVTRRLISCPALPEAKKPSMLVMVSPFAIGLIVLLNVTDNLNPIGRLLYIVMVSLLSIVAARLGALAARGTFTLSWWVGAFPLASAALAALRFAELRPTAVTDSIAFVILITSTFVIASMLVLSIQGLSTRSMQELRG